MRVPVICRTSFRLLCTCRRSCIPPRDRAAGTGRASKPPAAAQRDGRHDFDFEIGRWHTQLKRLLHPLTGSTTWVEYEGTSVVSKVWNGTANLVELDVEGPAGRIEGLSLRLYNPDARQWSLNFSNSKGGTLSPPTIGEFKDGRGEFYYAGDARWPGYPRALRHLRHHAHLLPFRAGLLG